MIKKEAVILHLKGYGDDQWTLGEFRETHTGSVQPGRIWGKSQEHMQGGDFVFRKYFHYGKLTFYLTT